MDRAFPTSRPARRATAEAKVLPLSTPRRGLDRGHRVAADRRLASRLWETGAALARSSGTSMLGVEELLDLAAASVDCGEIAPARTLLHASLRTSLARPDQIGMAHLITGVIEQRAGRAGHARTELAAAIEHLATARATTPIDAAPGSTLPTWVAIEERARAIVVLARADDEDELAGIGSVILGQAYQAAGLPHRTVAHLTEALPFLPRSAETARLRARALQLLGSACLATDDRRTATSRFADAVAAADGLAPRITIDIALERARTYLRLGRYADALKTLVGTHELVEGDGGAADRGSIVEDAILAVAQAWGRVTEDPESSSDHTARMASLAVTLSDRLNLARPSRMAVEISAHLHAVGLALVPEDRAGSSSARKRPGLRQQHPIWSKRLLDEIGFQQPVGEVVGAHLERLDGTGSPSGLTGSIPIEAQLVGIAHCWDDLIAPRRTTDALTAREALQWIHRRRHWWHPMVVSALKTEVGLTSE